MIDRTVLPATVVGSDITVCTALGTKATASCTSTP